MIRKLFVCCSLIVLSVTFSGCAALLVGAGGSALWQGGKIVSEESATRERAVKAVKSAFKSQRIELTDELTKEEVSQIRGKDSSNTKFAVDVFETGPRTSRIEVRVGLGEKLPAREFLTVVKKRL